MLPYKITEFDNEFIIIDQWEASGKAENSNCSALANLINMLNCRKSIYEIWQGSKLVATTANKE